jgi:nucleotide-binding universal stress UspA family protein
MKFLRDPNRPGRLSAAKPRVRALGRILVATNFDSASNAAVGTAANLARALGGSIHVLCVLEALMYAVPDMVAWAESDPRTHPEATRRLQEIIQEFRARGVEHVDGSIEYGIPIDVILRHANGGNFDLAVVGSHGRRGGVDACLVAHAEVPVIAVPGDAPGVAHEKPALGDDWALHHVARSHRRSEACRKRRRRTMR